MERTGLNILFRVRVAFAVVCAAFAIIVGTLWYLQVINGAYYRDRSENNRLRAVYVRAPRGVIEDRNGQVLVSNRPSFNVELVVEDCPDPRAVVTRVGEILGLDSGSLLDRLKSQTSRRRYEPKVIVKDATREQVARIAARRYELPGIEINVAPAREYPHGQLAAHALGYIREISQRQLESPRYAEYRFGDIVGQFGLESRLEKNLQGKRGIELVVVNAFGNRLGSSSFEREAPGERVTVTLDLETQRAADAALSGKAGAVVALAADTGEILALSSGPAFDPNVFTGELDPRIWRELNSGRGRALNNRVVQGTYAPGSVFKMVVAAAALAEGVVTPNDRFFCNGAHHFAGRDYKCHKKTGHGWVNLYDSLVQSCDVYYYTVGQRLGVDKIHDYSLRFGLGEATGLELVDEARGIIPSTEWKRRYFKDPANKKWFPGETLSVAIGQGAVTTTPLQLARAMAALVNGGRVMRPYLVQSIYPREGNGDVVKTEPREVGTLGLDRRILESVYAGLVGVVADPQGTGHRARLAPDAAISVGGKTGTAQVVALERAGNHAHLRDNAWFVGFAPAEKPEIVVAAIVENGGHGGAAAAPVVRRVLEAYFRKNPSAIAAVGSADQLNGDDNAD